MRIVNRELCALFSGLIRCEYCQRPAFGGTHCAHIFSRGAGQVDIPGNLIGLCAPCHHDSHNMNNRRLITRYDLLRTAAEREGLEPSEIEDAVMAIRRHPKHLPLPAHLERFL
jgi:hypothetical protein